MNGVDLAALATTVAKADASAVKRIADDLVRCHLEGRRADAANLLATLAREVGADAAGVIVSAAQFVHDHPDLEPPVIEGLVRRGELLNVIAAAKSGKTWLILNLGSAVATGSCWLSRFRCRQGRVLLVDNELPPGVLADRLKTVAEATGNAAALEEIDVLSLRSAPQDVSAIRARLLTRPPGSYALVVVDSLYRAWPADTDENDNGAVARVFAELAAMASDLHAAVVVVHHLSKGDQTAKSVTDLGSGAGAISRAADAHLALRRHEDEDCFIVEGVVRSFAPLDPFVIRRTHPLFALEPDADPTKHWRARTKADKPPPPEWTATRFVEEILTKDHMPKEVVQLAATRKGIPARKASMLLVGAIDEGLVTESTAPGKGAAKRYSRARNRQGGLAV